MIIDEHVELKWASRNVKYYKEKGYIFTSYGDVFSVRIEDLSPNASKIFIKIQCDYCKSEFKKNYQALNRERKNSPIKKDCCYNCRNKKVKESNLLVYGVESTNNLSCVKEKRRVTNIDKYGVENVMQNDDVKNRCKDKILATYGETSPAKNKEVKDKMIKTNEERYGFKSPTLNNDVRDKQIQSMIYKYGEKYPMQVEEVKEKSKLTMYNNQTAPCSKQQRLVNEYIGGELNFPVGYYSLDIAFPDEYIYVECDFSGHWLKVKLGHMTEDEWKSYELRRWYFLYRRGWKEIRIISRKDYVPQKEKLVKLIEYAKHQLTDKSSVIIDFDEGLIKIKDKKVEIDTII